MSMLGYNTQNLCSNASFAEITDNELLNVTILLSTHF